MLGPDGKPQVHKHGVEGAGILTLLAELVTAVAPGDGVGSLPHEALP